MKGAQINGLVVLVKIGNRKVEQVLLSIEEEMSVLGFIKEMKEINGDKIKIINGATKYIRATSVENTVWSSIKKYMENENKRAEFYEGM